MVNPSNRSRLAGLALASLLFSLSACLPPPSSDGDGGTGGNTSSDGGDGNNGGTGSDGGDGQLGRCGDGIQQSGEACDDGNTVSGDGCSSTCTVLEQGYTCETPGTICTRAIVCGDGRVEGQETCDDRNATSSDGCSATCKEEAGWNCPQSGGRCQAAKCGDGIIAGDEECEDGNATAGDGCSEVCRLESGYKCDTKGQPCVRTFCGDGLREGTEQCDDANNNMGDGCSPLCVREPTCDRDGKCQAVCGDNVILPGDTNEECDDGNTRSNDGCSSTCKLEPGFVCQSIESAPPDKVTIPFVFRDFRGYDLAATSAPSNLPRGHIDFENANGGLETGILGPLYTSLLGTDGKPIYAASASTKNMHGKDAFDQWYRDKNNVNVTVVKPLDLGKISSGAYELNTNVFFPLDGLGWVAKGTDYEKPRNDGHNFSFTSEARYWFEYKGTEVLAFRGDDDVWVYINGRLAVDIGGVHGPSDGSVTLSQHETDLNLIKGRIYEAVVFQAERHTSGSNYRLTLTNFLTKRTECKATCGNSVVDPGEECDDGTNAGGYGQCARGCVYGPRCGDKIIQKDQGETCDDGNTKGGDGCSKVCKVELN